MSSEKYVNNLRLFSSIFLRLSLTLFPYHNVCSLFWLDYRATNSKSHNHINALSCRDISDLIAHFPPVSIIDILLHCSLFSYSTHHFLHRPIHQQWYAIWLLLKIHIYILKYLSITIYLAFTFMTLHIHIIVWTHQKSKSEPWDSVTRPFFHFIFLFVAILLDPYDCFSFSPIFFSLLWLFRHNIYVYTNTRTEKNVPDMGPNNDKKCHIYLVPSIFWIYSYIILYIYTLSVGLTFLLRYFLFVYIRVIAANQIYAHWL